MGRKKSYTRENLIKKATEIFRDQGFTKTSTQMLVENLGINRFSLYAEFGSKQNLFEASLEYYYAEVIEANFSVLEDPMAGLEEIRSLLEFYGASGKGPSSGRGCLFCNTAVEFGPEFPGNNVLMREYFGRLSRAFRTALENEKRRGNLRSSVDVEVEANYFTATVLGMFVMIRAKAPSDFIENSSTAAIGHLVELCIGEEGVSEYFGG